MQLPGNTDIFIFDEVQNFLLASDLSVDFGGSGGVISAGTVISSHFVHKDTLSGTVTLSGTAAFNGIILGIIASPNNLDASDPTLGLAGTSYPTGLDRRGTQTAGEVGDSISFVDDTLTLTSATSSRPDQLRVITAASAVPVPQALWLFGSGLLGMIGIPRRKKAA
jgi:hypothetical protein